MSNWNRYCLFG